MSDIIEKTAQYIKKHSLIKSTDTVLAAFSGGADSTSLIYVLNELKKEHGFKLAAAHYNHCIRKSNSDRDEEFCRKICASLNIPFYSKMEDVLSYGARTGASIETAARILRYRFLYETAKKIGASSIATAHHAEDNAESMKPISDREIIPLLSAGGERLDKLDDYSDSTDPDDKTFIIRPLLEFKKSELTEFLEEQGLQYCTDETNFVADTSRNALRLNIIPEITSSINRNAIKNILRLAEIATEDESYLSSLAKDALEGARNPSGYEAKKLNALPMPIRKRAVRLALLENNALIDAEQTHIDAICGLLKKQSGTGIDLPSARARMVFGDLVIEKTDGGRKKTEVKGFTALIGDYTSNEEGFPIGIAEGVIKTPLGYFRLSMEQPPSAEEASREEMLQFNERILADTNIAFIDMDKLPGTLSVRTRREGDRFHPVNSKWRMKLKNFFISRRVDHEIRDSIPLVISGGEIVFIPGFVIADEVKLTHDTRRILRIEYIGRKELSEQEQ